MKLTNRPRVLYANDNQDVCDRLSRLLAFSGLEVMPARTVAEAIWAARTQKIDLYLFDTSFADDDGFELCRRMRRLDARTPILFFSGGTLQRDKPTGRQTAADANAPEPGFTALVESTVLPLIALRGKARYSPRRIRRTAG